MKNLLLFNYNIDVDTYQSLNDGISFYIDYDKYYFIKTNRVIEDIDEIYNLLNKYINPYHYIIKNRFNDIITKDDKTNYTLLKIKGAENREIDLLDIIQNQIVLPNAQSTLRRDNWGALWSDKVDYLEYQVSELAKGHPLVLSSFSYYVGLAENAIEYFNMLEIKNNSLVLSQKRIMYPNILLNFFNPLNLVIDFRVRDIAEYLKTYFFEATSPIDELKMLINKDILSPLECNLLFARLLYPSYYFDKIPKILENNEDEEILFKYINKVKEYESFLKEVFMVLSQKCEMIKIDWIIRH